MTCPRAAGHADARNTKFEAARAMKRRKAQGPAAAPPHVIDLTDSQLDGRNSHKQADDEEAVINLVNAPSAVVHLHGRNRLASRASASGHDVQTLSQTAPSISSQNGISSCWNNQAKPPPMWMSSKHQFDSLNQSAGIPAAIDVRPQLAACHLYIPALQPRLYASNVPNILTSLALYLHVQPVGLQQQKHYMTMPLL